MEAHQPETCIKDKVETCKMRRLPTTSGYPFCTDYFGEADPYASIGLNSCKINGIKQARHLGTRKVGLNQ